MTPKLCEMTDEQFGRCVRVRDMHIYICALNDRRTARPCREGEEYLEEQIELVSKLGRKYEPVRRYLEHYLKKKYSLTSRRTAILCFR